MELQPPTTLRSSDYYARVTQAFTFAKAAPREFALKHLDDLLALLIQLWSEDCCTYAHANESIR